MHKHLESRIARLEKVLSRKNESVDFESLADSLWDSQIAISDAKKDLYSKYYSFVKVRPGADMEYDIPENAFKELDKALESLNDALESIKYARRILNGTDE